MKLIDGLPLWHFRSFIVFGGDGDGSGGGGDDDPWGGNDGGGVLSPSDMAAMNTAHAAQNAAHGNGGYTGSFDTSAYAAAGSPLPPSRPSNLGAIAPVSSSSAPAAGQSPFSSRDTGRPAPAPPPVALPAATYASLPSVGGNFGLTGARAAAAPATVGTGLGNAGFAGIGGSPGFGGFSGAIGAPMTSLTNAVTGTNPGTIGPSAFSTSTRAAGSTIGMQSGIGAPVAPGTVGRTAAPAAPAAYPTGPDWAGWGGGSGSEPARSQIDDIAFGQGRMADTALGFQSPQLTSGLLSPHNAAFDAPPLQGRTATADTRSVQATNQRAASAPQFDYNAPIGRTQALAPILSLARSAETSTDPYNSLVFAQKGKTAPTHANLTDMTVAEVQAFQRGMIGRNHETTAVGAYQTIAKTLNGAVKALGLNPNTKFNEKTQDEIGAYLAYQRGFADYQSGKITAQQYADRLASEWASFANSSGRSAYQGVGQNKANTSQNAVIAAIESVAKPGTQFLAPTPPSRSASLPASAFTANAPVSSAFAAASPSRSAPATQTAAVNIDKYVNPNPLTYAEVVDNRYRDQIDFEGIFAQNPQARPATNLDPSPTAPPANAPRSMMSMGEGDFMAPPVDARIAQNTTPIPSAYEEKALLDQNHNRIIAEEFLGPKPANSTSQPARTAAPDPSVAPATMSPLTIPNAPQPANVRPSQAPANVPSSQVPQAFQTNIAKPVPGGGIAFDIDAKPAEGRTRTQQAAGLVGKTLGGFAGGAIGATVGGPVGGLLGSLAGSWLGDKLGDGQPYNEAWGAADGEGGQQPKGDSEPAATTNPVARIEEKYLLPSFAAPDINSNRPTPRQRYIENRSTYGRSL
jgi:muramidase (phage lysozyme)